MLFILEWVISEAYHIVLTLGMRENADLCALLFIFMGTLANTFNRKRTSLQLEHHIFSNNLWLVRSSLKFMGFFRSQAIEQTHGIISQ